MSATTTPTRRRGGGLPLFLAVTFLTSWTAWALAMALGGTAMSAPAVAPYLLGAFGPLFGALALRVRRARRKEPAPEHAVRTRPRALFWAPLMLVLTVASVVGGALLARALGGPDVNLSAADGLFKTAGGAAPFFVSILVSGPLSEEAGWRGTMYPRLRASMGRFLTSLLVGVVWAIWHLPLFLINGTVQQKLGLDTLGGLLFAVSTIPMALLTGYAYERAGVFAAVAVHFATNGSMTMLGVEAPLVQGAIIATQTLLALLLLATHRRPAPHASAEPRPATAPAPLVTHPGA
ncbi:CPBP family intramembrane glutamic endopeptidase [Streptomyces sp. NPDC054796]